MGLREHIIMIIMNYTPRGSKAQPDLFTASRPLATVVVAASGKWVARQFVALVPDEARLACEALNEYDPGWFAVREASEAERAWRNSLDAGLPAVALVGQAGRDG